MNNPSSIERLDYYTSSIVIDFELISYIALHEDDKVLTLTISIANAIASSELLEQHEDDDEGTTLRTLYLNTYTKWRNYRIHSAKSSSFVIGGDGF